MSFRKAMPSEPPTRGSAPGPRWGTSVPQTPCAPTRPPVSYFQILASPLHLANTTERSVGAYAKLL